MFGLRVRSLTTMLLGDTRLRLGRELRRFIYRVHSVQSQQRNMKDPGRCIEGPTKLTEAERSAGGLLGLSAVNLIERYCAPT